MSLEKLSFHSEEKEKTYVLRIYEEEIQINIFDIEWDESEKTFKSFDIEVIIFPKEFVEEMSKEVIKNMED